MYILQPREPLKYRRKFFGESLLSELDFASVETSYSTNLESCSDLCGEAALGSAEDHIEKFLARGHRRDFFPSSLHFCDNSRLALLPCRCWDAKTSVKCGQDFGGRERQLFASHVKYV